MTEEIKNEIIDESENVEETTGENPGKKTSETQKTFTQDELNKVVRDRVAREKKDAAKLTESWETERTELTATIASYEGIVKDIVKSKYELIPAEYQALVDKLPLLEQYEFLIAEGKKVSDKKPIPKTPLPIGEEDKNKKFEKKLIKI